MSKTQNLIKISSFDHFTGVSPNWEILPLKRIAKIIPSGVDKKTKEDEFPVQLCNYTDVYYHEFITGEMSFMKATATINEIQKFNLKKGDVIITKDSETPDDIAIPAYVPNDLDVVCGYHLTILRPINGKVSGEFLYRVLQSNFGKSQFSSLAYGVTRFMVSIRGTGSVLIPFPPYNEQIIINKFLLKNISTIEKLISKKQQLISLLEEKRQAIITQAVTKGLDPDVPMKDSGIEWLGEIPEHWEIFQLKRVCSILPSGVDKKTKEDEFTIELCNYTDVYYNEFITKELDLMKATAMINEIQKFTLMKDDVIITKDSETPDDIAVPAYVPNDLDVVCGYHLTLLRANKEILNGEFLFRSIQSSYVKQQFSSVAYGITRYMISIKGTGSVLIPLPPIEEQISISHHIGTKVEIIDKLVIKITQQIKLFEEYKQALITNVVTGKIDVRNYDS